MKGANKAPHVTIDANGDVVVHRGALFASIEGTVAPSEDLEILFEHIALEALRHEARAELADPEWVEFGGEGGE